MDVVDDQELKIAIVGPGGVGKSALALQYVQQLFVDTYDPTIQDNYRKKVNIQGKWYTLDILDTAGQDEFSALRSQYMANYEAFLLVCSITSVPSLIELRDFYKEIYRSKCYPGEFQPRHRIPCLMVANKIDLGEYQKFDEVALKAMTKELIGDELNYIYTSAKNNFNVEKCFDLVTEMAVNCRKEKEQNRKRSRQGTKTKGGFCCSLM